MIEKINENLRNLKSKDLTYYVVVLLLLMLAIDLFLRKNKSLLFCILKNIIKILNDAFQEFDDKNKN